MITTFIVGAIIVFQFLLIISAATWTSRAKRELEDKDRRINELEDILCPYGEHDYVTVKDFKVDRIISGEAESEHQVKRVCKKCKRVEEYTERN